MDQQLDILLMESHRGLSATAEAALTSRGHRVHRCFAPHDEGFPCVAMRDPSECPVDGGLDAAMVVRRGVLARPTPLEQGVGCAIRSRVPLVEDGPDTLDPYAPWVSVRVSHGDAVAACEKGAVTESASRTIEEALFPLLDDAGIDRTHLRCRLARDRDRLVVHLMAGSPLDRRLTQGLAVRALDAVRSAGRGSHRTVDVQVHQLTSG